MQPAQGWAGVKCPGKPIDLLDANLRKRLTFLFSLYPSPEHNMFLGLKNLLEGSLALQVES